MRTGYVKISSLTPEAKKGEKLIGHFNRIFIGTKQGMVNTVSIVPLIG